jgi:hypothetical protein
MLGLFNDLALWAGGDDRGRSALFERTEGAPMPAGRDTSLTLLERIQLNPDDPPAWALFVERYRPSIRRWCV